MSAMAAGGVWVGPAPMVVSPSMVTDLAVVVCVVIFLAVIAVIARMFALVWRRYSRVTGTPDRPLLVTGVEYRMRST